MIVFDEELIAPWVSSRVGIKNYIPGTSAVIGRLRDEKIIAGVMYQDYNGANVTAHIAGEGTNWMSRRFLSIIFDYPFNQLGVKRITGFVLSTNTAARNLDEKLGFEIESIMKDAHPEGDMIVYVMTREKCRWLKDLPYETTFK